MHEVQPDSCNLGACPLRPKRFLSPPVYVPHPSRFAPKLLNSKLVHASIASQAVAHSLKHGQ